MQGSTPVFPNAQRGLSLSGLIFLLAIVGAMAVLAMRVFPTFVEYRAIKDAIATAKAGGGTVRDMEQSFDKSADINRIGAISGKDLMIGKEAGGTEISFAYRKQIPITGSVSLLIDYSGTTARDGVVTSKPNPAAR